MNPADASSIGSGDPLDLRKHFHASGEDDLTCPGFDARDIATLRDSPDLRPDIDELCHTLATMKYTDEKPFPFPLRVVVIGAAVVPAVGLGLISYYRIQRDTDMPWYWSVWPWS